MQQLLWSLFIEVGLTRVISLCNRQFWWWQDCEVPVGGDEWTATGPHPPGRQKHADPQGPRPRQLRLQVSPLNKSIGFYCEVKLLGFENSRVWWFVDIFILGKQRFELEPMRTSSLCCTIKSQFKFNSYVGYRGCFWLFTL